MTDTNSAIRSVRSTESEGARARLLANIPVVERRTDLAGISTGFLEGGEGPPVILLHEQGEFGASWVRVIPALAKTYRVIAPDMPGHGTSEAPADTIDADLVFAWLDELIDQTCSELPALVGHMMGGAIAARYAVNHSDRLGALVLVDSFGLRRFIPPPRFAPTLIRYLARPSARSHDRLHRYCTANLDTLQSEMGTQWDAFQTYSVDRLRTPAVKAALGTMMRKLGVPAIPHADLARISVPTTLIWGRHDPLTRIRTAEAASARYGWRLSVIERAGDMPAIETPDAFVDALREAVDLRGD